MSTPINSKHTSTPEEKLLAFFLISVVIGIIFSCYFFRISSQGRLQQWEIIGKVPDNTKEVINGSYFRAYIRDTENKVLSCSFTNQNECWIPDVNPTDSIAEACNSDHVAFSPAIHPPANSISCVFTRTGYGETADDVIYLIDQEHNLWRWLLSRSGGETPTLILMAIAGGLAGALIGSIIWIVIRLLLRKRSTGSHPLFSWPHIFLLAIPWMCLFGFLGFGFFMEQINRLSYDTVASRARRTSTQAASQTETAREFQIQVTPSASSVRYNFSTLACGAEWTAKRESIPCVFDSDFSETAVRVQSSFVMKERGIKGQAILAPAKGLTYLFGEFPAIEIQEGDHFRAMVACIDTSLDCNVIFTAYLHFQNEYGVALGRWEANHENRNQEIDVDLTKFAGKFVRFTFDLDSSDYVSEINQDFVWIFPRIENSKGTDK